MIDPARADSEWGAQTDPAKQRGHHAKQMAAETAAGRARAAATRPVPQAAIGAVADTLRDAGTDPGSPETTGGEVSFMRARMAIDSGDGVTTDAVYTWVRAAGRGQAIAIKGVAGFDRSTPVDGPTYVEVTEAGRTLRRGVQLWKVAGAVFKSEIYRFLRLVAPTDEELAEGAEWQHGFVDIPKGTTTGLVTVKFRSPNSFMRPFAQMPRGFCRLATSGDDADYRSR
jgi:hypothetical protein